MQLQSHTSLARILVGAALITFAAAPAALADQGATAPVFPSAVPAHPAALTGPEGATNAARAQQSYYTSYGKPAPLAHQTAPTRDGGIDWSAIGIAIVGTCLLAGVPIAVIMRTRRRPGHARIAV